MKSRLFLDTNILLYSISTPDWRADLAEAQLRGGGFISVQVLNEFVSVCRRKLKLEWDDIGRSLHAIRRLCSPPVPITVDLHEHGFRLAAQHQLRIYDAVHIAAALKLGCDTFCSEDLQHGRVFEGRLTVRNPFLGH